MLQKRWIRPLGYGIAILTASILSVLGLAHDITSGGQSGSILGTMMAIMAVGMLISAYGLYADRHGIRALILRHSEVHKRLARRKRPQHRRKPILTAYPRPRDAVALALKPVRG